MMSLYKFENVTKTYKKQKALDNFTWEIEEGKIQALLGHNGAGKTTAFMIANRIIPFNNGRVLFEDKDIKKMTKKQIQRTGFMTEKLKLYDELNVKETLSFFADIYGIKDKKQSISKLIDTFDLGDFLKKKISKLSTGMYKKTVICTTFLNKPDILFLDEPFAGLDPVIVKEISSVLKSYIKSGDKTIILSSHNLSEIEAVSDKITIMKDGKLIVSDSLKNLINKYKIDKSFNISYLDDSQEKLLVVKDEKELYNKLKELENNHILSITENKISLNHIYNQIYAGK
jgi:ABC-type multidrug transport system ATPase subunit